MSDKKDRTRISVTLTKIYVDAMDHLVDEGFYLNRGGVFLEALRILYKRHGIEPFTIKGFKPETEKKVEPGKVCDLNES